MSVLILIDSDEPILALAPDSELDQYDLKGLNNITVNSDEVITQELRDQMTELVERVGHGDLKHYQDPPPPFTVNRVIRLFDL